MTAASAVRRPAGASSIRTYVRARRVAAVGGGAGARASRAGGTRRRGAVPVDRVGGRVRAAPLLGRGWNDICGLARLALFAFAAAGARAHARRQAAGRT